MTKKLEKILKRHHVTDDMKKYILGETNIHSVNKDLWYYYWKGLVKEVYKKIGFETEYMMRVLKLLFKYETYEQGEIYFGLFKKDKENYIKAIEYLTDNIDIELSEAIYLYLKDENSLRDNHALLKYFYEKDSKETEKVIEHYSEFNSSSESGGFCYYHTDNISSYLRAMEGLASDDFKEMVKISALNIPYKIMAFSAYLPFFKNEEDKKEVILKGVDRFLNEISASSELSDALISYLDTGEKVKNFDKLLKKIATHNKSYLYTTDFTNFIKYKKLNPDDIYEQRLVDISMKIDKYRTIQRLLFTIYNSSFNRSMKKSYIDELIENWEAINYENIIDFLAYHIAVEYYGLNAKKFFKLYLEEEDLDKTLTSLTKTTGKALDAALDILYEHNKEKTNEFILNNIAIFKGKSLINKVVEILQKEKKQEGNVIKMIDFLKHKKSNVREIAVRYLINLNDEKNIEILKKLRETEKSKAILELLGDYLNDSGDTEEENDYFGKKEILKRANTKKLQDHDDYSSRPLFIWKEDGSELPEYFAKHLFYLLKRGDKKTFIASAEAQKILSMLTIESIRKFIDSFDESWFTLDFMLRILPYTEDDKYLDSLKKYIADLIWNYRGATAAKVVNVIAGFKTTKAVQLLDFLSLKKNAKDARVNRAAIAAMENMAKEMNLSKEDLLDFIIPDFGFDKNGELVLDFGPRQFTVALQSDLSMLITDNNGKTFKNLPKVGKNDDAEKGGEAAKLFKSIKKDLKKQVKLQKERLERGFSESRFWSGENWLKLFVNNPVMRQFAMNLVWGKYKNGVLTDSFRYLDDGTFSNIDDDELNIENGDIISLVHPVELTEEQLEAWKEILDDYEITQPFEQINRPVFKPSEADSDKTVIDSFKGYMLSRFALKNNLFKFGWNRGAVEDAGCFYYYDKQYGDGTQVSLDFLGDYVGNYDDNKDVPVYDITLSKNGKELKVSELSPRLYSELYYELKKITEKGSGFNKDWEKESW